MNKKTDNKINISYGSDIVAKSPTVLVSGKTSLTKNETIKSFGKIISNYGSLTDFRTDNKKGINFFIEIDTINILPLIYALEKDSNLVVKEIKDLRTAEKTNRLRLVITFFVQFGE